jgi:hypothetical protein
VANKFSLPGIGSLVYCKAGDSLNGKSVSDILAAAKTALGGGAVPAGYTISSLNDLITNLNESHDNCTESTWAKTYLKVSCSSN